MFEYHPIVSYLVISFIFLGSVYIFALAARIIFHVVRAILVEIEDIREEIPESSEINKETTV